MKCNFQVLLKELTSLYISERNLCQKKFSMKIKGKLTQELKDYLQPMEIIPVKTAIYDNVLIL